jgi:hypothetical protein
MERTTAPTLSYPILSHPFIRHHGAKRRREAYVRSLSLRLMYCRHSDTIKLKNSAGSSSVGRLRAVWGFLRQQKVGCIPSP